MVDGVQNEDTVVFVPSACKDAPEKPAEFHGSVTLAVPDFEERFTRMAPMAAMAVKLVSGTFELNEETALAIANLVRITKGNYRACDITRVRDGKKYTSFQDLSKDSSCNFMVIEIAKKILEGFDEGNVESPK